MKKELDQEIIVTDIMLRLTALENILLKKGVFTKEEYSEVMHDISSQISKTLLEKANVVGDLDQLLKEFKEKSSKKEN